jgi:hypothetical protein
MPLSIQPFLCLKYETPDEAGGSPTAGSLAALLAGGFIPLDRAYRELQADVKAASRPWLAIDHSRGLREFAAQGSKQRFFARLPMPLGNHPSAVGADVTRERPFGNAVPVRCCQVHRELRGQALLDSAVEKHSTKVRRWSGGVHGSLEIAQRKGWVYSFASSSSSSSC